MMDPLPSMPAIYLLMFSPLLLPLSGWFFGKRGDLLRRRDAGG